MGAGLGNYEGAPSDGSAWERPIGRLRRRVMRGQSFQGGVTDGRPVRRGSGDPGEVYPVNGFRPAR